jgi:hypothetical protein
MVALVGCLFILHTNIGDPMSSEYKLKGTGGPALAADFQRMQHEAACKLRQVAAQALKELRELREEFENPPTKLVKAIKLLAQELEGTIT